MLGTSATLSTSGPSGTARFTVSPVRCDSLSMAGCIEATKSRLRMASVPSRMTSQAQPEPAARAGEQAGPLQHPGQPRGG